MSNPNPTKQLSTVNNFVEKHKDFATLGGIRHLRFHSSSNGFKTAFKKIGSRILIDEEEFFKCVERINEASNA